MYFFHLLWYIFGVLISIKWHKITSMKGCDTPCGELCGNPWFYSGLYVQFFNIIYGLMSHLLLLFFLKMKLSQFYNCVEE